MTEYDVPGKECEACGAVWPCDKAGEEVEGRPHLICPNCGAKDEIEQDYVGGTWYCAACGEDDF